MNRAQKKKLFIALGILAVVGGLLFWKWDVVSEWAKEQWDNLKGKFSKKKSGTQASIV